MKNFREPESKIIEREFLKENLSKEIRGSKTLVLTNGCFDILHIGHVRYLKAAKECGDILLVAINSDNSERRLKGEKRPIIGEMERAIIVASLYFVDYVTIFEEDNVHSIIKELKPEIHCKGGDYSEEDVPEREEVLKNGGVVKIVGGEKLRSTSELILKVSQ